MRRFLKLVLWAFILLIAFVFVINLVIYLDSKSHIYSDVADAPSAQVALIPGAGISSDGVLSPLFLDRVDTAVKLYETKKVSKILVSGDNSTETYNEVNPVRLYLLDRGIPDEDIFLDHAGFDTYSTMYRARDIFGVSSVLISTQAFHLPRSVFIAHHLGIEAYGVDTNSEKVLFRNYVREALANEKAVLNLMFNRKPKFLGEKIPITGDGRAY